MGPRAGETDEGRLDVFDGLRGIAILLVLWSHVWQESWLAADVRLFGQTLDFSWIPRTGFIGVDLFFFISGFCLFYPYARTLFDGRPQRRLGDYAWHRARKILPSYLVALAVLAGFTKFHSWQDALHQIAVHLTFIHPWFADTFGTIDGVLWSLGVEVQFYVMFPLLCRAAMRRPWATFATMCAAAIAFRIGAQMLLGPMIWLAVSQVFAVLDLFAAGMAAAYVYRAISVRRPQLAAKTALWTLVALAGFAAVEQLSLGLYDQRELPNWIANWYVLGRTPLALAFFALALGSLFAARWWRAVLANPALAFLSIISYNLYLWHLPIVQYLGHQAVFPWHETLPATATDAQRFAYSLLAVGCSIALATLATYALERPLLRLRRPRFGPPLSASAATPSVEAT